MTELKPWYLSKSIWGGVIAVAASLSALLGAPVEAADQAALTDALLQAVAAGGAVLAVVGRIAATSRIF